MSVVDSVKIFKGRELTEDEYFHAALVGWCVELVSIYQPALSLQQLTIHYL
jgi:farnesyl diphosphate synthase